nr:MAG TPA: hypothetical protein [Caudoviricetes sp.]
MRYGSTVWFLLYLYNSLCSLVIRPAKEVV